MASIFLPVLNQDQVIQKINAISNPYFQDYLLAYSTWLGGVVTDPHWMILPLDERLVTRGDGVFETLRVVNEKVYLLDQHLARFWHSAKKIGLGSPLNMTPDDMKKIILELVQMAGCPDMMIRTLWSRGPGNFSANPYEPVGPQLYVIITKFHPISPEKYQKGVHVGLSQMPVKPSWLAQIKSCNYLPNVLVRKEAIDRGFDYLLGVDAEGYLTEGPTENFILIDSEGVLTCPHPDFILQGTTMARLFELARQGGWKTAVRKITIEDILKAQDVMMIGTSFGLLPVTQFENKILGAGVPSLRFQQLLTWLSHDMELYFQQSVR